MLRNDLGVNEFWSVVNKVVTVGARGRCHKKGLRTAGWIASKLA
jgi:hypothetical protein